jgi:hypothetical protein
VYQYIAFVVAVEFGCLTHEQGSVTLRRAALASVGC